MLGEKDGIVSITKLFRINVQLKILKLKNLINTIKGILPKLINDPINMVLELSTKMP